MQNKLIFIGPVDWGNIPTDGVTMKNQLYLEQLGLFFDKIYVVDTHDWKCRPWVFIQLVWYVFFQRRCKIFLSASRAWLLIRFLYRIKQSERTYCSIVGGNLLQTINRHQDNIESLKALKAVFVQGKSLRAILMNDYGMKNVYYLPNSKPYYAIEPLNRRNSDVLRFVFLSRIHPEKGIGLIFNCIERLNNAGLKEKFTVDFYGRIAPDYHKQFDGMIEEADNAHYRGVLNLKIRSGYEKLSEYDVMLFPTYWYGEGFPGVVVDAYIAGLPLIASDWNLNAEVITEQTGIIIPARDEETLYMAMRDCIMNVYDLQTMGYNCQLEAAKYDNKKILSREFLLSVELLH